MAVIISAFSNCWALWQHWLYAVYMIYGSVTWSMCSFQPAQCSCSAKCGWCNAKLHWICNQCWRFACTNVHTRTCFILPPVGTIVCIQPTSGLHHSQTKTTTQPRSIMRHTHTHTHTHISISLIFNTSSCTALSEWNTEAQCCTSSSSKKTDFPLTLSAWHTASWPAAGIHQHTEVQTHMLRVSACKRACKHLVR